VCECCKERMHRHGYSEVKVKMIWGECKIKLRRWRCERDGVVYREYPKGMDGSGLSPEVLKRSLDLSTRLPYREAVKALEIQGIEIGLSECERLSQRYGKVVVESLGRWVEESLGRVDEVYELPKTYVVELDGVMVIEKDKPQKGQSEGREVKQVVVYELGGAKEKHHIAQACNSQEFELWIEALLTQVGVQKHDYLIGIGDGARWLDESFVNIEVKQRILDVYHASEYLEKVMLALGFNAQLREAHRASWYRGDINARVWFKRHLPDVTLALTWSQEARDALAYLQRRFDQMDYWLFKQRGYPIGSGVVEGANKSVIGARMKRSGMHWSKDGINRMAALRSLQTTSIPWIDFHSSRLLAFYL
jgi:hypothetical protein